MTFKVMIDKKACSNCGICVNNCEKGVFAINANGDVYVKSPSNCIGCRICANSCLCNAISVKLAIGI